MRTVPVRSTADTLEALRASARVFLVRRSAPSPPSWSFLLA